RASFNAVLDSTPDRAGASGIGKTAGAGAKPMKKLVLETTAPFQGLPELVAYDEGLFAEEGLQIEWVDRDAGVEKKVEHNVTTPKGVDPFASHGRGARQGRPVQCLRMGQLLPRSRDRPGQPATRPSRHCQLCSDRGTAGFAGLHAAAARQSG